MDNLTLATTINTMTDNTDLTDNNLLEENPTGVESTKPSSHNSLEDSVCRPSVSSVREIIKKYEPNHMTAAEIKRGSYGSIKSSRMKAVNNSHSQTSDCYAESNSREIINHHIVYEDQQTAMLHNEPVQEYSPRRSLYRVNDVVPPATKPANTSHSYRDAVVKRNLSNEEVSKSTPRDKSLNVSGFSSCHKLQTPRNPSTPDNSYQSKTTISKTSNGVRIITDIFFDPNTDYNWQGSRIETDIPPSKILKEFQDKNY